MIRKERNYRLIQVICYFFLFIFCSEILAAEEEQKSDSVVASNSQEENDNASDAVTVEEKEASEEEGDPVVVISDLADMDDEALYKSVFGEVAEQKSILLDYDVLVDGEKVGNAPVFTGKVNRIQAAALKTLLESFLKSEDIALIDKKMDKEGFVSFDDLTKLSFKTRLNRLSLCVEVSLPIEKKKVRRLGESSSRRREIPNAYPAAVSAFCNIRAAETFHKEHSSYNTKDLVLAPAINLWGLCVEGSTSYSHSSNYDKKGKFKRDYTTAVYDFANYNTMLRFGDVFSHSLSYQSVPHVWGININKDIPREMQSSMRNNIQITILRTSTVEVYSDGHLIRTKTNVAPGTYIFDDISYKNGSNDIKIKIIDDTGKEQILDESCYYESSYVPKGEFTFDGTYGYPEVNNPTTGRYDKKNGIMSGTIRYGLLPSVDVGFGMLKNKIGNTTSYEVRNKNILGSFDFKFASSNYKQDGKNISGKVFYTQYGSPSFSLGTVSTGFSLSYERADNFFKPYLSETGKSTFGSSDSTLRTEENLRGKNTTFSYGAWLSNVLTLNFNYNGSVKKYHDGAWSKNSSFSISKGFNFDNSWFSNGSISAVFSREHKSDKTSSKSWSLYCSLSFKNNISLSCGVSKNDNERSEYVSLSHYPERTGFGYNISMNRSSSSKSLGANMHYSHHLFRGNVSHSRNNLGSSSTNVGLETGIFFADGRYGIARPINSDGGFVIVTPKKALADETLKFVDNDSESGFLGGGAVVPNSRGTASTARLNLKDLPMRLDVKKDTIVSYGEYKRGFVADVEAEGSYTADGYLIDSDGKGLPQITGYAIHTTDITAKPIAFFTNSNGRFVLTELIPGKYKISINVEGYGDVEIEINGENDEIIHLGKIVCNSSD